MACGVSHYQVAIPSYLDGPYLTPLLLFSADVVLSLVQARWMRIGPTTVLQSLQKI